MIPRRWVAGCLGAAAVLFAGACGGSGASGKDAGGGKGGGGGNSAGAGGNTMPLAALAAANTPVEKCKALSDVLCARERTCFMTSAATPCDSSLDAAGLCAKVEAVDVGVTDCAADISALSCRSLFPGGDLDLPGTCGGILTFVKTQGEKQCDALVLATCRRGVECVEMPATPAESNLLVSECVDAITFDLDCSAVNAVSSMYPVCINKTNTLTCAELFPAGELTDIPECKGALEPDGAGGSGGMPPKVPMGI